MRVLNIENRSKFISYSEPAFSNSISFRFNNSNNSFRWDTDVSTTTKKSHSQKLSKSAIKFVGQINSYKYLKVNWDSYGGVNPHRISIANAIEFVKNLDLKNQDIYFVAPTPKGQILIELSNHAKSIEFYLTESNQIEFALFRSDDVEEEGFFNIDDDEQLRKYVAWLNIPI